MDGILTRGTCKWGFAEKRFDPDPGFPLAGHSLTGKIGLSVDPDAPLHMRTLILNPGDSEEAVICFMDLQSGSVALLKKVRELMSDSQLPIALVGSHTHYGPGNYFGNPFYDTLAGSPPEGSPLLGRVSQPLLNQLARTVADTIREARGSAKSGRVAVIQSRLWKSGANRSFEAFERNGDYVRDWNLTGMPGEAPLAGLDKLQKAIDPRVTTILAVNDAQDHICAFSTASSHTTCLGPYVNTKYSGDWPGIAVNTFAGQAPAGAVYNSAFVMSAGGDVSSLPLDDLKMGGGPDAAHGDPLKKDRGAEFGMHVAKEVNSLLSQVMDGQVDPISVSFKTKEDWNPQRRFGGPLPGWPIVAGAEDGHGIREPDFEEAREGFRITRPRTVFDHREQYPKRVIGGPFLPLLRLTVETLKVADTHPVCQIRIGSHLFLTAPGELTTVAGYRIEEDIIARSADVKSASIIANTNDYMSYFTTPQEYRAQHYEGGQTLFGRRSLPSLLLAHRQLLARPSVFVIANSPAASAGLESIGGITAEGIEIDEQEIQTRVQRLEDERANILNQLKDGPVIYIESFEPPQPPTAMDEEAIQELAEIEEISLGWETEEEKAEFALTDGLESVPSESQYEVYGVFLSNEKRKTVFLHRDDDVYESQFIVNFGDIENLGKDVRAAVFVLSGDPPAVDELKFVLEP